MSNQSAVSNGGPIAFIGGGVMAEAMIRGVLQKKLFAADEIRCSDPLQSRLDYLHKEYGVRVSRSNYEVASGANIVVFSIKPQALHDVAVDINGCLEPSALRLSIMAGISTKSITRLLGDSGVVRVMPNTPAQIGEGISVWYCNWAVSETQKTQAQAILTALGLEHEVKKEEMMDMATALSGSGPAYTFLFMEALVDAGVHLGFSRQVAKQLVVQTVKGSAEFAAQSDEHIAHLRNMVTSPGGTTAEALYQLEKGGIRTVVSRAVAAAYQKSVALSQLSD